MSDDTGRDWCATTLGRIVTLQYGKSPTLITNTEGDYDLIGTSGVLRKVGEFLCDTPSVVIGRKGTIDKPIYADRPFWATDTTYYALFEKNLDPKWFYYQVSAIDLTKYNEASGVPSLGRETLNSIALQVPPLDEQKKIAEILATVDKVIENTEAEVSKLEDLKKATMNELLTKGIGHTEFKETEIGRIPKSWSIGRFGDSISVQSGYAFRTTDFVESRSSGLPIVRMSNLKAGKCDLSDCVYVSFDALQEKQKFALRDGDFVFGMSGSIGSYARIARGELPCYLNQRVGRLQTNAEFRRFFEIVFLSEYFQNEVRAISAGGAQANISATQIEDIVIAIPHPSEQEVIVRFDVLLSTEIESKKITLDKVKVLKASLLQDLLTGKVRVKVN